MAKITLVLYNNQCPLHFCSHIEAIVADPTSQRTFKINFASFECLTDAEDNKKTLALTEQNNGQEVGSVTLYSTLSYDAFILNYYHRFGNLQRYHYARNNCADAVSYALDYFFPDKTKTDLFCQLYQIACCWLCLGSCGVKYFPVPPGILSPYDIYQKAQWLASHYGSVPEPDEEAKAVCVCEQPGWKESQMSDPDLCDNALTLAILNRDMAVARHFLEFHLASFNEKHLAYAYLLLSAQSRPIDATHVTTLRPADFTCLREEDKAEEKISLLPAQDPRLKLLAKHAFTRMELRLLVVQAVKNNLPLSFIAPLCEYKNGFIYGASTDYWLRKKHTDNFNPYLHAHRETKAYFKANAFMWFNDYALGEVLLDIIVEGDFAKATEWLTAKPGINKKWHRENLNEYAIHYVANSDRDDVTLFKLLAECEPVSDLTKTTQAGQNVLTLATGRHNPRITRYLVENHAPLFPKHIEAARVWLATLPVTLEEVKLEPVAIEEEVKSEQGSLTINCDEPCSDLTPH